MEPVSSSHSTLNVTLPSEHGDSNRSLDLSEVHPVTKGSEHRSGAQPPPQPQASPETQQREYVYNPNIQIIK